MNTTPKTTQEHRNDWHRPLWLGALGFLAAAAIALLPNAAAQGGAPSAPFDVEDRGCGYSAYTNTIYYQGVTIGWNWASWPASAGFKVYWKSPTMANYAVLATIPAGASVGEFHHEPPYGLPNSYYVTAYTATAESLPSNIVAISPCDIGYPAVSGAGAVFGWTKASPTLNTATWSDYSGLSHADYRNCPTANHCFYGIPGTQEGPMPVQPNGATTWTPSWQLPAPLEGYNYVFMFVEDRAGLEPGADQRHTTSALSYIVKYDSLPPAVGNAVDLGWRNTWPVLGGVSWTDPHSGLNDNFQYADGSTANTQDLRGWTTMPVQPTPGQTTAFAPSWTPSGSTQGMHHIQVKATDLLNTAGTAEAYTFGYDTIGPTLAPIVSSTHPDQTRFFQSTSFTAELAATDTGAGLDGIISYLTTASTCPSDLSGVGTFHNTDSAVTVTKTGLGPFSDRTFCAQGKDIAGNLGPVALYRVRTDTVAPAIDELTPTNGFTSPLAQQPIGARYNEYDGNADLTEKSKVDAKMVHLYADNVDVVAFWAYSPACLPTTDGYIPGACPLVLNEHEVRYTPTASWPPGVRSLRVEVGDDAVPSKTVAQSWSFTAAPLGTGCPPGSTGTIINGVPVCVAPPGNCPTPMIGVTIQGQQVCLNPNPGSCPNGQAGAVVNGIPACTDEPDVSDCEPGETGITINGIEACAAPPATEACEEGTGLVINGIPICVIQPAPCPSGEFGIGPACVGYEPCPPDKTGVVLNGQPVCIGAPGLCPEAPEPCHASVEGETVGQTVPGQSIPAQQAQSYPAQPVVAPATCTVQYCTAPTQLHPGTTVPVPGVTVPGSQEVCATAAGPFVCQEDRYCAPLGIVCIGPVPPQPIVPATGIPVGPIVAPALCSLPVCLPPTTVVPANVIPIPGTPGITLTEAVTVSVSWNGFEGDFDANLGETTIVGPIPVPGAPFPIELCANGCPLPVPPTATGYGSLTVFVTMGSETVFTRSVDVPV